MAPEGTWLAHLDAMRQSVMEGGSTQIATIKVNVQMRKMDYNGGNLYTKFWKPQTVVS